MRRVIDIGVTLRAPIIFAKLGKPGDVVRELPLDAAADVPARLPVRVGQVWIPPDGVYRMFDIAYGPAANPVKERRAPCDAGPPIDRPKSIDVGAYVIWVGVRVAFGVGEIIAGLRADNERPNLVIIADVRAAKDPGVAEPLVPRTDKND
jgi:hypothetical protein